MIIKFHDVKVFSSEHYLDLQPHNVYYNKLLLIKKIQNLGFIHCIYIFLKLDLLKYSVIFIENGSCVFLFYLSNLLTCYLPLPSFTIHGHCRSQSGST